MPFYRFPALLMLVCALLTACGEASPVEKATPTAKASPDAAESPTPTAFPALPEKQISRRPAPAPLPGSSMSDILARFVDGFPPPYVDLRASDLKGEDLSNLPDMLLTATFDSKTQWPPAEKLPANFDWQAIMDNAKNPGLGLRTLHKTGITGKGVGIAIVGQTLLVNHVEYREQLHVYEEMEDIVGPWREPQQAGSVAASTAVGKTTGVAPEADLYFVATGDCMGESSLRQPDLSCKAQAIRRIIQINRTLPRGRKIRAIVLPFTWSRSDKGYLKLMEEIKLASAIGLFISSPNIRAVYGWNVLGLSRNPLADPDDFFSYEPAPEWREKFFTKQLKGDWLLLPSDARAAASPTGFQDYTYNPRRDSHLGAAYLAGIYALAAQARRDVTPQEFWETALETGQTTQIEYEGQSYDLMKILDPLALIFKLQNTLPQPAE